MRSSTFGADRAKPAFLVSSAMSWIVVEAATAAREITDANPACWRLVQETLDRDVELVSHENFKERSAHARAVIRTGEATPCANVLLRCGVPFA